MALSKSFRHFKSLSAPLKVLPSKFSSLSATPFFHFSLSVIPLLPLHSLPDPLSSPSTSLTSLNVLSPPSLPSVPSFPITSPRLSSHLLFVPPLSLIFQGYPLAFLFIFPQSTYFLPFPLASLPFLASFRRPLLPRCLSPLRT